MHTQLAKKLIEVGAIRENTEFQAHYRAHGLSCISNSLLIGTFLLKKAIFSNSQQKVFFEGSIGDATEVYRFSDKEILSLDGMPIERVAEIYDLYENGEEKKKAKRRGRKPKNQKEIEDGSEEETEETEEEIEITEEEIISALKLCPIFESDWCEKVSAKCRREIFSQDLVFVNDIGIIRKKILA